MKKFYLLLLSALCAVSSFAEITGVEKLYVVGDATAAGWDNGKALNQPMVQQDGKWVWVGEMYGGKGFKFLVNDNKWENFLSCSCADDAPGNVTIVMDEAAELVHYPTNPVKDYKFEMPSDASGIYTITIDLVAETVLVTKGGVEPEKPDLNSCCLIGSATTADWESDNALPMTLITDGYFIWTGELKAGELKFLNKIGADLATESINPTNDVVDFELTGDYTSKDFTDPVYDLTYKGADKKFFIKNAGRYTVCVNLKNMVAVITKAVNEFENVFLNGGATAEDGNWTYTDIPFTPVADEAGVFTWTGDLYAPEKTTEFKFRTAENWSRVLVAYTADVVVSAGNEYPLSYIPVNGWPNNNNFKLSESGKYKFTIDLNTMTLKVDDGNEIGTGVNTVDVANAQVLVADGVVSIVANGFVQAAIYDLTGKCLNQVSGEGTFTVSEGLTNGVYVLKMMVDGKELVQKVMVK